MKFLRVISVVLGPLLANLAGSAQPEVFTSPTAGFQLTKPADWHYVTAAENLENLKAAELNDAELKAAMEKYATAPLVAMMKHAEPYDDLNPSFKVNVKPYGPLKGKSATELLGLILPQLSKAFPDFQLVQAPKAMEVAGIKSAYARIHYTLRIPDGRTFPTASELWIVPHGDYFFLIGAGTRQDEATGTRAEVQDILRTVKIAHAP